MSKIPTHTDSLTCVLQANANNTLGTEEQLVPNQVGLMLERLQYILNHCNILQQMQWFSWTQQIVILHMTAP